MDRLIEEMVALAGSHQAHRLCLFGSRARGDHRPDSDYDFALWGIPADRQPLFLNDVEELPSLCKIDVVFVDQQTDPALLSNIQADGVILMDKFDTKLENFHRALLRLRRAWPDMTKPRINSWRGMALFNGLSSPVSLPGKLCGNGCWTRGTWSLTAPSQ